MKLKLLMLLILTFNLIGDIGSNTTYKTLVDSKGFHRVSVGETEKSPPYENYTLHINVGDQIIWINDDSSDIITIISEQELWKNDSAILRITGKQFNYTFNDPGIYTFYVKRYKTSPKQTIIVSNISTINNLTENKNPNSTVNITTEPTVNMTTIAPINVIENDTGKNISPTTNIDKKNSINENAILMNPILIPLNILGNLKIIGFATVAVIIIMSLIRK